MLPTRALVPFVLLATLSAQAPLVSPAFYAVEEGTTTATLPFGNTRSTTGFPQHSQQVIGGLQGPARVFRSLSFRRDGTFAENTLFDARTVDLDLHLGHGTYASASATFSANYATPRQQVFARRGLSLPSLVTQPRVVPAPFLVSIPFDTPFPYSGTQDLVWEVNAYSQLTGAGSLTPVDASFSGMNLVMPSGYTMNGQGCTAQGTTNEVQLRSTGSLQNFPVNAWILALSVSNAPSNAAGLLLLGFGNPNVPVPGLCTNLFVNPKLTLYGTTPASGAWQPLGSIAPAPRIAYAASLVGTTFEAQAAVGDATVPYGLKLVATNGLSVRLNDWTPTFQVAQISESGASTGTGTLSTSSAAVVALGF
ncbi:MAG: hypothetical protein KDC87_13770 [Planctomycetes bacterium]|nr:hypothetical protein [Planctomycetota bacterium]MCB9889667.1 hypothetical protein [Planctomycetota bacterium]